MFMYCLTIYYNYLFAYNQETLFNVLPFENKNCRVSEKTNEWNIPSS